MNQKLTLTIEKEVIEKAKEYASKHRTSVSGLVENFLALLISETGTISLGERKISEPVKNWGCGITVEDLQIDKSDPKMAYLADKYLHV